MYEGGCAAGMHCHLAQHCVSASGPCYIFDHCHQAVDCKLIWGSLSKKVLGPAGSYTLLCSPCMLCVLWLLPMQRAVPYLRQPSNGRRRT